MPAGSALGPTYQASGITPQGVILFCLVCHSSCIYHIYLCSVRCVTGLTPTMRCPCCKAAVHETAFHKIDKKTTFVVGETVLKWDLATTALQKTHEPVLSRIEVRSRPVFPLTLHFDRLPGQFCRLLERLAGHYIEHCARPTGCTAQPAARPGPYCQRRPL